MRLQAGAAPPVHLQARKGDDNKLVAVGGIKEKVKKKQNIKFCWTQLTKQNLRCSENKSNILAPSFPAF